MLRSLHEAQAAGGTGGGAAATLVQGILGSEDGSCFAQSVQASSMKVDRPQNMTMPA